MEVNNGHATKKHRDIGITNPYYTDTAIKKDLKDDIALLQSAFKKFNEEFWDGEIDKSTIIHIGVRRHIVVGANCILFSVYRPTRLCRIGTYRRF